MEEKTVSQVMLPLERYATVSGEKTLREALLVLSASQQQLDSSRHPHRAILVLDEHGAVIGKLSHWAVLRALEPKLLGSDDLSSLSRAGLTDEFIRSMQENYSHFSGSLEQMCARAARLKACDAMVPVNESIEAGAPLTDAIRQLVATHAQSLLVTEGGKVVGILRLSDVFEELARLIREEVC